MIVPMKKASLIVMAKDSESSLFSLRKLGLLHIEHKRLPQGGDIDKIKESMSLIKDSLGILSVVGASKEDKELKTNDWRLAAKHIIDSYKRIDQLEEYSRALIDSSAGLDEWGDFDPDKIKALAGKGIHVRFYKIPQKELANIPKGVIVKEISFRGGIANCMLISRELCAVPYKEFNIPKIGLKKIRERLSEDRQVIETIKQDILKRKGYYSQFLNVKQSLEKELELAEAKAGMAEAGELTYLTGFLPGDKAGILLSEAKKQRWGIVIGDPSEEDRVPTLIRTPKWVSIIRPVFKVIEVVPGYKELDISMWFLIFLSIFFGMLIGDAGYGMIFLGLTLFSHIKFGKKLKGAGIFILFYVLSSCAVVWGILSGTIFGQEWLAGKIQPLVPQLRDDKFIQSLCFLIGVIHLTIAHLWRLIVKLPGLIALAECGWALILWGAFFLAKTLILGEAFPPDAKWLFTVGSTLVVFFTSPNKNILKGIGPGVSNLLLNIVNNFTDIVSYIRLFAVGLATVAVADAFNKMALDVGFNNFSAGLMTAFILVVGHVLNIVLGPMSILVHGVRLNVLEFCSHLDIKWSGFKYQPLQEAGSSQ